MDSDAVTTREQTSSRNFAIITYLLPAPGAAGLGGCAGGDAMDVEVSDRLYIDFSVKGTEWTQTVVNSPT